MGKLKKKPKAAKPPKLGEVLTLAEAATYLRVSEAGLRADADAGLLPGHLIGGEWRFTKEGILRWLSAAAPHAELQTRMPE